MPVPAIQKLFSMLSIVSFGFLLTSCEAIDKLQEDCEAGDESACEILETIGAAIDELEDAVPEDLTLASAFEEVSGYLSDDKADRLALL